MHEIHEISWNPWKSMKINGKATSWNRVKVSLGASSRRQRPPQAANLGWNLMKSHAILGNTHKSMEMHEIREISWNHRKSVKIDEKAASWNRVKISLGASSRWQTFAEAAKPRPLKSMKSHEMHGNTYKFMKMHEIHEISRNLGNPWKSMKQQPAGIE